jgi:hypothetical protein
LDFQQKSYFNVKELESSSNGTSFFKDWAIAQGDDSDSFLPLDELVEFAIVPAKRSKAGVFCYVAGKRNKKSNRSGLNEDRLWTLKTSKPS